MIAFHILSSSYNIYKEIYEFIEISKNKKLNQKHPLCQVNLKAVAYFTALSA